MTEKRQSDPAVRRRKLRRAGLVLLAVLLLSAIPAAAWLSFQRQVAAVARIGNAYSIVIGAGAGEDMNHINISGIDMSGNKEEYVFSVLSNTHARYRLQLAYTTNNPFTYTLYHAVLDENNQATSVAYDTEAGDTKYYMKNSTDYPDAIQGSFLNQDESGIAASNASFSYGEYSNVEAHDKPLYWQSYDQYAAVDEMTGDPTGLWSMADSVDGEPYQCCDYYILEVSWPNNLPAEQINNKETDIIYITALAG